MFYSKLLLLKGPILAVSALGGNLDFPKKVYNIDYRYWSIRPICKYPNAMTAILFEASKTFARNVIGSWNCIHKSTKMSHLVEGFEELYLLAPIRKSIWVCV